jgi:hypothetical protein
VSLFEIEDSSETLVSVYQTPKQRGSISSSREILITPKQISQSFLF